MTEPAILLFTLLVLLIALAIWAVVGHVLWQMGTWTIRQMLGRGDSESVPTIQSGWACLACDLAQPPNSGFCGRCGRTRPTDAEIELLKDLGATERQLARFLRSNKITTLDFDKLQIEILEAREILTTGKKQPTKTSSEPDIFINGVENSPWLPLILGAFALAGVFSGIIFRIRGLLLLGAVFLLLSIVTMIWYASANMGWTWLWYVAGIVTGATIIFMFAMFEKKRSEVLRVVEGFREWDR